MSNSNEQKTIHIDIQNPEAFIRANVETDMTPEEQEEFLNGTITRKEAALLCEGWFSNEVMPPLLDYLNKRVNYSIAVNSVALQILLNENMISQDEIESMLSKWEKLLETDDSVTRKLLHMQKGASRIEGIAK